MKRVVNVTPDLPSEHLVSADLTEVRKMIFRFIRCKLDRIDEVEDLVQEVFLRVAARRCDEFVDNPAAYFYRTAASVLGDRYRRRRVRRSDDHIAFDAEQHAASDFDPARILEGRQSLRAAVEAIDTLPDRTRTVFLLRRLEGHAFRDIASQLSISVSAAEKHMAVAIHSLSLAA